MIGQDNKREWPGGSEFVRIGQGRQGIGLCRTALKGIMKIIAEVRRKGA
jgi:hypothetical protein